jgi:putative oxidoreductase
MNERLKFFFSSTYSDAALLILRLVIGFSFAVHGYPKITGGMERWTKLGGAMSNVGIEFLPAFWGFMAAFFEFFGGIILILGLFTRFASGGLIITMLIAAIMHLSQGEGINRILHPLELLAVCLFFLFFGAGKYAIDQLIVNKWFGGKD